MTPLEQVTALCAEKSKSIQNIIEVELTSKALEIASVLKQDLFNLPSEKIVVDVPEIGEKFKKLSLLALNNNEEHGSKFKVPLHEIPNFETNPVLRQLALTVRPLVAPLRVTLYHVECGLELLRPQVEEGVNYALDIQDKAIKRLNDMDKSALALLTKVDYYHYNRSENVAKYLKNSTSADIRQAILDQDFFYYRNCVMMLTWLRNEMLAFIDFYNKNKEKIMNPDTKRQVHDMY